MPFLPRRLPRPPSREVGVLSAVAFSVAVGYGLVAPVLPQFATSFGVSKSSAGLVLSVFAFMRIVGALGSTRLVDRLGERILLATGIGIVGVSSLLAGASQTYGQLLALRGAGGIGSAMFSVSAMSIVLRSTPRESRGRAVGLFSGSFLLGGICGPAVGSTVAGLGLRMPFFIYAGTLLVAGGIGLALLPRRNLGDVPVESEEAPAVPIRAALRTRAYRTALYTNMADHWAALGIRNTLIPLFVVESLMVGDEWAYRGFFLVAIVNGLSLYPAGRWADGRGRKPVLMLGLLLLTSSIAMLAVARDVPTYLAAMVLFGIGSGLLQVAPAAMVGDVAGGKGGPTVAAFQMAGDVGAVLGPFIAGKVVDTTGSYSVAFWLTAAVVGAAVLLAATAPETRRVAA